MRILHVITGLNTGGAELALAAVAPRMAARGHQVTVVSLLPGGVVRPRLEQAGVAVADLGMAPGLPDPRGLWRLARIIRKLRPDVVQGWMYHGDLAATLALALSGRRRRTRLAWGVRCSDMDLSCYGRALRVLVRVSALLSGLPDAVIANSQAGRDAHRALGYRPRRFEVVPNGIDADRFRPDPEARRRLRAEWGVAGDAVVAVHAARVDPMKDHPTFLAALARCPEVTGILAGSDTESLALPPNARALGRRDHMPAVMAAADLVVSSSVSEGFPNVVAEGMAAGAVPVVTDAGDARLLVGPAGWVVPPRDPAALAGALAEAARGDHAALGAAARARILEHFTLDRCADAFLAVYDSLARA